MSTALSAQTTGSGCSAIIARANSQNGGANLAGFTPWGGQSGWTRDISADPVDPYSRYWIASIMGSSTPALYADPVVKTVVVTGGQTRVPVPITSYPTVSDPGPYPVPLPPLIQGVTNGNYAVAGDKHLTIIDKDNCLLYETYNTVYDPVTQNTTASLGAVWDLLAGDHQRPYLWAGGSVSGLPWSFNAVRYDEVNSGHINHALTFAALGATGRSAFTDMASSSQYGQGNVAAKPPFGARARLKASFDISGFPLSVQVILKALKQYGMVYIDGSQPIDMHFEVDDRWNWTELNQLRSVLFNSTNFDFVKTGPIYTDPMYGSATAPPQGAPPVIGSFTASASSIPAGASARLSWSVAGASSRVRIITPEVGPVVANSAVVTPATTTTYTLAVENAYGVSRKTVTVNVIAGSCVPAVPAEAISPASQAVAAGQPVSYLVSITNTDSAGCARETFALSHTLPAGWTGTYSPANLTIAPGGSATTTLTVLAPANGQAGSNPITAAVSGMAGDRSATATGQYGASTTTTISLALSTPALTGGKATTGTVTLGSPAPASGAAVSLASSAAAATTPASVTIPAGATSASFAISTTAVATSTTATISASYSGLSASAALRVDPPALSAISLSPASLSGGASSASNSVVLTGPAAAATVVTLASSNAVVAAVPLSVTVPAGSSSAPFTITTSAVSAATSVAITASYGGIAKTANVSVQAFGLSSVLLSPATMVGGNASTANKVVLSAPAPVDTVVTLRNANLAVSSVPAQVVVPAGSMSATFSVKTYNVSSQRLDTVFATLNGVTKSMNLTVNPVSLYALAIAPTSIAGGTAPSTSYVKLDGPAGGTGVVVTLTCANPALVSVPASVTVPAGATVSPKFAVSTSTVMAPTTVAVTAVYGAVSKNVTLTLNPPALSWIWLSPNPAVGGTTTTYNTVTLTGPALAGGAVVTLSSSNPALAAVPATVAVAAGATTSPYYAIATANVTASTTVTITASFGGVAKTANLTLNPVALSALSIPVTSVTGGTPLYYNSVLLSGPAGPGGVVVALSSSNPAVLSVPATVTLPPGTSKSSFTMNTSTVAASSTVAVTATYSGVSKIVNVTVNP